ncbi:MAG: hypothetical protein A2W68_13880 [Betaproteobacteria bacterium RIFCSPLOWO2_02_64_14]|nr:MAG: hypothetical protein A2W68_13880 [Betaproteobacteria bacterium RIFCSPLOWO2_02_64_14]
MCLILFAHKAHRDYPLIMAANRDEAYARPSAPAAFWDELPHICAGRDLGKGGTWLGITRAGRIAAVTNYRDPTAARDAPLSRGALVKDFLAAQAASRHYLSEVGARGDQYNGFILIAGDLERLDWLSNRGPGVERIAPGVHGLSNHLLDTPWPKIQRARQTMESLLSVGGTGLVAGLFEVLADRTQAPDHELPDTGVGVQRERELSSIFVSGGRYGTRASTLILVHQDGSVLFVERSYGPLGVRLGEVAYRFDLQSITDPGPAVRPTAQQG